MRDSEKPTEIVVRRKAPTPEQLQRRAEVDARNEALQRTKLPQPKSGTWGGTAKPKKT